MFPLINNYFSSTLLLYALTVIHFFQSDLLQKVSVGRQF